MSFMHSLGCCLVRIKSLLGKLGLFEQRMCGLQQAAVQEVAVHHLLLMRLGQNMHVIQQSCTVL